MKSKEKLILGEEGGGDVRVQMGNEAPTTTMAERMDLQSERNNKKVLKAEAVANAQTFEELLRTIAEIDLMHGKKNIGPKDASSRGNSESVTRTATREYTKLELTERVNNVLSQLLRAAENDPEELKVEATKLPADKFLRFLSVPEEKGLRTKVIELYNWKRTELMSQMGVPAPKTEVRIPMPEKAAPSQPPAEETPEAKAPAKRAFLAPPPPPKKLTVEKKPGPNLKKEKVIDTRAIQEKIIESCEIEYLNAVRKYRTKLKQTYETIVQEREDRSASVFKKIFTREPRLSDKDYAHLRALRDLPAIAYNDGTAMIKRIVAHNGGDDRAIDSALSDFRIRAIENVERLSSQKTIGSKKTEEENDETIPLNNDETKECELVVFEQGSYDLSSSKEELEKNRLYIEQKNLEDEEKRRRLIEEAALGKFVPAKSPEETYKEVVKNPSPEKTKTPEKKEEIISPEKTIKGLELLHDMKQENKSLPRKAIETMKGVSAWYNQLSWKQKLGIACGIAAVGASGGLIGGALGAKFIVAAFAARNVKQAIIAGGVAAGADALLTKRAERRKSEGLEEDFLTRRKEIAALGTGVAYFFVGKFVSKEVGGIIKNTHITEHIRNFFHSPETAGPLVPVAVTAPAEVSLPHEDVVPPTVPVETTPAPAPTPEVGPEPTLDDRSFLENDHTTHGPEINPQTPDIADAHAEHAAQRTHIRIRHGIPAGSETGAGIKKEILINDKLGTKGNSIWGSLRHNGVSERAIANYEKAHPHAINKFAHNKDRISFIYDKHTDTLKEVKVEKALRHGMRAARSAITSSPASGSSIHHSPESLHTHDHGPSTSKEHAITEKTTSDKPEANQKKVPKLKPRLPKAIINRETSLEPQLPEKSPSELAKEIADGPRLNEGMALAPEATPASISAIDIEATNPAMAAEVKNYFGDVKSVGWKAFSNARAAEIIRAKTPEEIRDIVGRNKISLQDAKSAQGLIKALAKANIRLRRGEKVFDYIADAVNKLQRAAK